MNIGTGSRSKLLAALLLSTFALILTARTIRTEAVSSPLASSCAASGEAAVMKPVGQRSRESRSFDPTIHLTRLVFSESKNYEGSGRNIFSMVVGEQRKRLLQEKRPSPPPAPKPVAAAPLSLRFYGFTIMPNNPRRVFIRDEDALFIAREGDIVDRRYRIGKISADSVDLEDLIEHRLHTLLLTGLADGR